MKVIFVDKQTKQAIIYTTKSDLCDRLKVSPVTLWNWSKEGIKETNEFIVFFDVVEHKNKSLIRLSGF